MKHPEQLLRKIKERLEHLGLNDQELSDDFSELEELLMFYHKIIARCPFAIFLSDIEQCKLIWANERANEMLGRNWKEISNQGKHFFDENLHPQDQEDFRYRLKHFDAYPNQVQATAFRMKDEEEERYQWKYALVAAFERKEGKPYRFMSASFNLDEAIQDRLNFFESYREQTEEKNSMPTPANPLTSREREILRLIVRGFTMRQIAEELKISHHTAGTHRKNLFKKARVNKTSELVHFALKNGLD